MKTIYYLIFFLLLYTACSSTGSQKEQIPEADPMEMPTVDPIAELMQPKDSFPIAYTEQSAHVTNSKFPLYLSFDSTYPDTVPMVEGKIFNFSPFDASFGDRYTLKYYQHGAWENSPLASVSAADIGYSLLSDGGRMKTKIYFEPDVPRQPGKYLVTKKVWLILTAEFCISENSETRFIPVDKLSEEYFATKLARRTYGIDVFTDSLTLMITNFSTRSLEPYNHYFIERYNEEKKYWYRYYYPSFSDYYRITHEVLPGNSIEFKIPLLPANVEYGWEQDQDLYKGKYRYHPGRYRVCKYTDVEVTGEFSLVPTRR